MPIAALAASMVVAAGCGGSEGGASADEATSVLEDLKALGKGEIVISGMSSRAFGPFTFKPGGYVLQFERSAEGTLAVTLEPEQGSSAQRYTALAETANATGRRKVTATGKLRVRVRNTGGPYELRFTPSG